MKTSNFCLTLSLAFFCLSSFAHEAQQKKPSDGQEPSIVAQQSGGKFNFLDWPRMSSAAFGCMLEKKWQQHRNPLYNCESDDADPGDPCFATETYYEGPEFPDVDIGHPLISEIHLEWEGAILRSLELLVEKSLVDDMESLPAKLGFPKRKPENISDIYVQSSSDKYYTVTLQGFEHTGAGELDCEEPSQRRDFMSRGFYVKVDGARLRKRPKSGSKAIGSLSLGEKVFFHGVKSRRQKTIQLRCREQKAYWMKVTRKDQTQGWIHGALLQRREIVSKGKDWKALIYYTDDIDYEDPWSHSSLEIIKQCKKEGVLIGHASVGTPCAIVGEKRNPNTVVDVRPFLKKYHRGWILVEPKGKLMHLESDDVGKEQKALSFCKQ